MGWFLSFFYFLIYSLPSHYHSPYFWAGISPLGSGFLLIFWSMVGSAVSLLETLFGVVLGWSLDVNVDWFVNLQTYASSFWDYLATLHHSETLSSYGYPPQSPLKAVTRGGLGVAFCASHVPSVHSFSSSDNASFMSISAQQPSSTRAARLYRFGNSWLLLLDGSFCWIVS